MAGRTAASNVQNGKVKPGPIEFLRLAGPEKASHTPVRVMFESLRRLKIDYPKSIIYK